jgi:hypothetical protein
MQVVGDAQEPVYNNDIDLRPGTMIPAFLNEKIRPLEVAQVNNQLVFYQQATDAQMAMSGFHPNFLTGITPAGPDSGYGIVQQRIATTAKITTTNIGEDRFLSRLMTLIKDIIVAEWDYGDAPIVLSQMMGESRQQVEQPVPLSKEAFEAVREISVEVMPEIPLNDEAEKSAIFQANSQGLLSDYRAIDRLAYVDDPEEEQERIAAEMVVKTDPMFGPPIRLAMAAKWMERNGVEGAENIAAAAQMMSQSAMAQLAPQPPAPPQPAPVPSLPSGGAVPAALPPGAGPPIDPAMMGMGMPVDPAMMGAMPPGMPMDPSMMGGPPMPGGPQAPLDPAMIQALMQQGAI